jgi:hypothetical protein
MLPTTLPSTRKPPVHRHPAGGSHWLHLDRLLVTLCLLASVTLLYRCLVFTGGLLPLYSGGAAAGATIVSTTVRNARGPNVVTELVIDRQGRTHSTTVTQDERGMSITVLGSGASLHGRRAALRRAAAERSAGAAAALDAQPAGQRQQRQQQQHADEPEAYPGLPRDFDAEVGGAAACLALTLPAAACAGARCALPLGCTGAAAGMPHFA